jgi:hypothetical protein
MTMKKKMTYVFNILFMVLVLFFTFYALLKGKDLEEIWEAVLGADKSWLVYAVGCGVAYLVLQAVSLQIIIRSSGTPMKLWQGIRYTFVGFLFNAITPSASGGQPMQVYFMRQDNISVGISSVALLFWTIIYKVALVLIEAYAFFFHRDILHRYLGSYEWLFWLGVGVNLVSIILYSIVVFSRNGVRNLAHAGAWVCQKLRVIRHKKRFMERLDRALEFYREGAVYMRSHWEIVFFVLLITLAQRICYFAITWFVCLALGVSAVGVVEVILVQSFVSVCIDILPLPGGVGANEGFFVTLFQKMMNKNKTVSAMLLSRGAGFYVLLILSAFVTIGTSLKNMVHTKA